jgi:hypothetical protein
MIVILRCREGNKAILLSSRPALSLVGVMVAAVSILMAGHLSQIVVWSITYALVGAAPSGTDYLYFASVNYTTLGYGDVVPARRWNLLGPITAINGMLLFGRSTVIFHVLTIEIHAHPLWPDRHGGSDRTGGPALPLSSARRSRFKRREVLAAIAEFERDLIRERTGEGRKRAMANGVRFGRKTKLSKYQRKEALRRRAAGKTLASTAKSYAVDASMISRL